MAKSRDDLERLYNGLDTIDRYTQEVEGGLAMHIGNYFSKGRVHEVIRLWTDNDLRDEGTLAEARYHEARLENERKMRGLGP